MTRDKPTRAAAERIVVNAELDAAINAIAERLSFGDRLAVEGATTVALDDEGALVELRPDGTRP